MTIKKELTGNYICSQGLCFETAQWWKMRDPVNMLISYTCDEHKTALWEIGDSFEGMTEVILPPGPITFVQSLILRRSNLRVRALACLDNGLVEIQLENGNMTTISREELLSNCK